MSKKPTKPDALSAAVGGYAGLLADIKQRIRTAQVRTAMAGNASMLMLYWEIGGMLAERQKKAGWGAAALPRLAVDLQSDLPEVKGFSARNMRRMIQFHQQYPALFAIWPLPVAKSGWLVEAVANGQPPVALSAEHVSDKPIWPLPVAKLADRPAGAKKGPRPVAQLSAAATTDVALLQRAFTQIPWAHNVILIQKVKHLPTRLWYAQQALEHGWSRDVLALQIQSGVHLRQGQAVTNFQHTLPPPQSDLAAQLLKDPYFFDFLTLEQPFHERELEAGLLRHLQDFLVELGTGFAFVGRQVHLDVGDDDFYVDLLFYHLRLRCFVVIDLKVGPFKAEYAGKMNFYLNAVDDRLKHATDQPAIGLILCENKNKIVAEYALRGMDKAIGVSAYQLTRALPKKLQSALPSIAQLEQELAHARPAKAAACAKGGSRI